MDTLVSIGKVSKELGVSTHTLRSWEKEGLIVAQRTPNGHRRYNASDIKDFYCKPANTGQPHIEVVAEKKAIKKQTEQPAKKLEPTKKSYAEVLNDLDNEMISYLNKVEGK
jgi:DNA-binding transcriptional MerR regulator